MSKTWIHSRVFSPKTWCWYSEPIRTNNDVEGWHNRFNRRSKNASLPFYVLLVKLRLEAKIVDLNCHLVDRDDMKRRTSKKYALKQERLEHYWEELRKENTTFNRILLKMCQFISPSNYWETQVDPQAVEEMLQD